MVSGTEAPEEGIAQVLKAPTALQRDNQSVDHIQWFHTLKLMIFMRDRTGLRLTRPGAGPKNDTPQR